MKKNARCTLAGMLLPLFALLEAQAAQLLDNGDFETGATQHWQFEQGDESEQPLLKNTRCYRTIDAARLGIHGHYAAMIQGQTSPSALLSASFSAGDGVAFIALSVLQQDTQTAPRRRLMVEIVDTNTLEILARQAFAPQTTPAADVSCEQTQSRGTPRAFSSHFLSTRPFAGRDIRLRFSHVPEAGAVPLFTLLDQLTHFAQGEQALFQSRPYAQAGMRLDAQGQARLSASGSLDPDQGPLPLRHSWYLEGHEYTSHSPCLPLLQAGSYRSILYVNDGKHAVSDSSHFYYSDTHKKPSEGASAAGCEPGPSELMGLLVQARTPAQHSEAPDPPPPAAEVIRDAPAQVALPSTLSFDLTMPAAPQVPAAPEVESETMARAQVAPPDTELVRAAYALERSGIRWRTGEQTDERLVIITPAHFPRQPVSLLDAEGRVLAHAEWIERTPEGERYRFPSPGSAYPAFSLLRIGHTDYLVKAPGRNPN